MGISPSLPSEVELAFLVVFLRSIDITATKGMSSSWEGRNIYMITRAEKVARG